MTRRNGSSVVPGQIGSVPRMDGDLRDVMALFPTGVTVLTTGGDHIHGMTANTFASVSLEPPLVLVCVARAARMHRALLGSGSFGVSVLTGGQEHVARYFAGRSRPSGAAQFDDAWVTGAYTGAPLLASAAAWMECEVSDVHDGGDHSVLVGGVLSMGRKEQAGGALAFYGGRFHRIEQTSEPEG